MISKEEMKIHKDIKNKYPNIIPEMFYCLVPEDKDWSLTLGTITAKGREAMWGAYSRGQNGYIWATKRYPLYSLEQLETLAETDAEAFKLYNKLKKAK